jgi:hypothetical protein
MGRPVLFLLPLLMGPPVLTGCSVPVNGLTGVSRDADRHPVAVFAWCGNGPPDGARLYLATGEETTVADYHAPALAGQVASVRLDAAGGGWTATPAHPALRPGVDYSLYGWTSDNSTSTAHVDFQLADLDGLTPGMVFVQRYDEARRDWVDTVVPEAEFRRDAEAGCG